MAKQTVTIEIPSEMTVQLGYDAGTFVFNIADLSPATVENIFDYGLRQVCNDGGANPSKELVKELGESVAKTRAVRDRAESVQANEHNFGGGGGRLSMVTRVLREYLAADLSSADVCGAGRMKKSDAVALVRADESAAFAELCNRRGVDYSDELWEKYYNSAEKTAAQREKELAKSDRF